MMCESSHQHVGDRRAEHGDVDQQRAVLGERRQQEADDARDDERDGGDAAAGRHRQLRGR
jgi:hypothetical protein